MYPGKKSFENVISVQADFLEKYVTGEYQMEPK